MSYIENPKTEGSGIVCCIPQTGACPVGCDDCFFQSGRSYLEPLADNLPNIPAWSDLPAAGVVRMNDGNDSNVQRDQVIEGADKYDRVFFNTSIPKLDFPGPVVLTVNPGDKTYTDFHRIDDPPKNLMFVRVRACTWNRELTQDIVEWYIPRGVPVVLTFLAFFKAVDQIPEMHREYYTERKRTLNTYTAIKHSRWAQIIAEWLHEPLVHSCGTEDTTFGSACKNCGNCLREYHATKERMNAASQ